MSHSKTRMKNCELTVILYGPMQDAAPGVLRHEHPSAAAAPGTPPWRGFSRLNGFKVS